MTVETVSMPERLAAWEPVRDYFYFELSGETSPALDISYGELAAVSSAPDRGTTTRVFEYTWTIGHLGVFQHRLRKRRRLGTKRAFSQAPTSPSRDFWANLKDVAAEVYVLFPQTGGWRANEIGATMKYLSPLPQDDTFFDRTAKDEQLMQPLATAVGQLANVAVPGAGAMVAGSARVMGALAQMKLSSVPQTEGFPWSVATAVRVWERQAMAGVAWSVPKSMFDELGGRISGGVAVIFGPAREQGPHAAPNQPVKPEPRHMIAQAVVHSRESRRAPRDRDDYVKLRIAPTLPPA